MFRLSILILWIMAFVGCEMYNDDMISSLDKNPNKISVRQIELVVESKQKNDFGYICIPTDSEPLIIAYIDVIDGDSLDTSIGAVGTSSDLIQVSRSVLSLASVTESNPDTIQVKLSPAGLEQEHTDFILTFDSLNQNEIQNTSNNHSMQLRYNTPPCQPLGVGVDEEGNFKLLTYETWGVVSGTGNKTKDGYIFWAWPAGMTLHAGVSEKEPNCVAGFVLNGRAYTPRECATNLTISADDGTVYDLYKLQVGSNQIVDLYAKDVESVRSTSLLSCVNPVTLKLNARGGFFTETMNEELNLQYREKSKIALSDLPEPVMEGYAFGGWALENKGEPVLFPITVENDITLSVLWQETSSVGEVRNLQALYNLKNNSIDVTWKSPYVFDVSQIKLTLIGKDKNQESVIEGKDSSFIFENIEKNIGDYTVLVQLIGSMGRTSKGIFTNVSTNVESFDEVANVQATVLSERIDFKWTSPSKKNISHIELFWKDSGVFSSVKSLKIEKDERFISFDTVKNFPSYFTFKTVGEDGTSSEGVSLYTIAMEFDENLDTADGYLVVPENTPVQELLSSIEVPTRLGFKFDGWYTDSSHKEKFNSKTSITEPVYLYAKWSNLLQ